MMKVEVCLLQELLNVIILVATMVSRLLLMIP